MPNFRTQMPLTPLRRTLISPSHFRPTARFASTATVSPRRHYLSTTLLLGGSALLLAYYYDSRSLMHEHVVMPLMRAAATPEEGHRLAVTMLGLPKWMRPRDMGVDGERLQAELFGVKLKNPVGIAAGFDKDADAIDGLFDLGFGYVEVGSVTPEPQPGNPKPRFFRLEEDDACINRYGFNSLGHGHTLGRLRARLVKFSQEHPSLFPSPLPANPLPPAGLPRSLRPGQLLAVNLGKNKTSAADSNEDYVRGMRSLGPYADVVVINVSSPNTPGLRALQGKQQLESLLGDVVTERNKIARDGLPKIAVKVTADLSEDELADVASAVRSSGVDGVVVSNTTIRRQELGLASSNQNEVGGVSGKPLFPYALQALKTLRPLLPPSIPIMGCGGVSSGSDAIAMANAGASIVQLYTTFGFHGVGTPRLIKDDISENLKGSSWVSQIGQDWASQGNTMGWDEDRVKQESEALKKEAQNLGDLLRQLKLKEDTASLVAEAEKALGLIHSQPPPGDERAAPPSMLENASPSQVEGASSHTAQQGIEGAQDDGRVNAALAVAVGAPSIGEALNSEPVQGVDFAPVVVLAEQKIDQVVEKDDNWVQEVKNGRKRLV